MRFRHAPQSPRDARNPNQGIAGCVTCGLEGSEGIGRLGSKAAYGSTGESSGSPTSPRKIASAAPDSGGLGYPFTATDAGKASSHYKHQRNDCTVRALATATGLTYDHAHRILAQYGRLTGRRFDFKAFMKASSHNMPRTTYPAIKGARRMNPVRFSAAHPAGTYIVQTAKHVIAVIDGTFYDSEPPPADRCIYSAWRIR